MSAPAGFLSTLIGFPFDHAELEQQHALEGKVVVIGNQIENGFTIPILPHGHALEIVDERELLVTALLMSCHPMEPPHLNQD